MHLAYIYYVPAEFGEFNSCKHWSSQTALNLAIHPAELMPSVHEEGPLLGQSWPACQCLLLPVVTAAQPSHPAAGPRPARCLRTGEVSWWGSSGLNGCIRFPQKATIPYVLSRIAPPYYKENRTVTIAVSRERTKWASCGEDFIPQSSTRRVRSTSKTVKHAIGELCQNHHHGHLWSPHLI